MWHGLGWRPSRVEEMANAGVSGRMEMNVSPSQQQYGRDGGCDKSLPCND